MSLTTAQQTYWGGSLAAGVLGAIGFGIGAAMASGGSHPAYIAASIACGLVAVLCLIVLLVKR